MSISHFLLVPGDREQRPKPGWGWSLSWACSSLPDCSQTPGALAAAWASPSSPSLLCGEKERFLGLENWDPSGRKPPLLPSPALLSTSLLWLSAVILSPCVSFETFEKLLLLVPNISKERKLDQICERRLSVHQNDWWDSEASTCI